MRYHIPLVRMAVIKKDKKQSILARMGRRGNVCALLVAMQIFSATVENIMKFALNIKTRAAFFPLLVLL